MNVLFIAHENSKSGAVFSLLTILKWLKKHESFNIKILINRSSNKDIVEFEDFDTYIFSHSVLGIIKLKVLEHWADIIYSNTLVNGNIIKKLSDDSRIITHARELDSVVSSYEPHNFKYVLSKSDKFIAISKSVKEYLISKDVSCGRIKTVYNFIEPLEDSVIKKRIVEKDIDIIIIGFFNKRKGSNRFLKFLELLNNHAEKYYIVKWVGPISDYSKDILQTVNDKMQNIKVEFTGKVEKNQVYDLILRSHYHISLANEEPFGRVALEALQLEVPTLCLEKSCGLAEIVNLGMGMSFKDELGMVKYITQKNADINLNDKLINQQFSIERNMRRIASIIREQ